MSCAASISLLFLTLMQLVNGAKFLNVTFLLMFFTGTASAAVFGTIIVP